MFTEAQLVTSIRAQAKVELVRGRLVHLDIEDTSEVLLAPALLCHKGPARRIQSPLLGALERKIPLGGYFACSSLVLYGIRIVGFQALKGPFIGALMP